MSFAGVIAAELMIRMAATGAIVILVALAVSRLGPLTGGALAGLPMVLGPGFYFLIRQAQADFVSQAAAYSLLSLCATQVFLLTYIAVATRISPIGSICLAIAAWAAAACVARVLPPHPVLGGMLFVVLTIAARVVGTTFLKVAAKRPSVDNLGLIVVRGVVAGVLVAAITAGASHLGADWSGLLMAFPVGYSVLSVTIHEQFGSDSVTIMLHSALLGTMSLAGFCFTLAVAIEYLSSAAAFGTAVGISVVFTVGVVVHSRAARSRLHEEAPANGQ